MYIKFQDSNNIYEAKVIPNGNVVTLEFKSAVVVDKSGFLAYKDKKCEYLIGKYLDYTTIYRNDEETQARNSIELSNDGSEYVSIIPLVTFGASDGGSLDGIITQEVTMYEHLAIPTPVPEENYEFTGWSPEIPESGKIEEHQTFTAIFTSLLPSEPTLEERVMAVEEQNATLSMTMDIILTDVIPSLM